MRSELRHFTRAERQRLEKRISTFQSCGRSVLVRTCTCCGTDRCSSGSFAGTKTCKCRACPSCAWVRARKVEDFFESAIEVIPEVEGYEWQFVVLTTRYNPRDPQDVSREALRSRAMLARRMGRRAWEKVLKARGAGMFRVVECSPRGAVHTNLVYYGPPVDKDQLEATLAAFDPRCGSINAQPIRARGKRLPKKGQVARTARYAAKGMEKGSFWDEDWLSGGKWGKTIAPELAARWELAVTRLQLTQKYGVLRSLDFRASDYSYEPENDSEIVCESCGAVGEWKSSARNTVEWILYCHDRNKPALRGSKWHRRARARDG